MTTTHHLMTFPMKPEDLRKYRRTKRESQGLFWARFGVTQSRGSRFEKGAEIPRPVAILLELYFNGVVTDDHLEGGNGVAPGAKREQATAGVARRTEVAVAAAASTGL